MSTYHPEARELNKIIETTNAYILELLSEKGKAIFFPKKGLLKQGAEAKGKQINATIGMAVEDDQSPMRLSSIAQSVLLEPEDVFPYASSFGIPELRNLWHKMIHDKNPSLKGTCSLPLVTNGISHGLSMTGYLFIDPGDEIIISDMLWGNYRLIFEHGFQGKIRSFNTFKNNRYDLASLKTQLIESKGKKIILLNFPNNPTGYTVTEDEADSLIELIQSHAAQGDKMIVIMDDAYFGLVYQDKVYQESLFARLSDLHENVLAVKLDGATKEDYAWGFRVGFITYGGKQIDKAAYQALESKTGGAIRGSISSASHISQRLLLKGITSPDYLKEKEKKYNLLKSRYDRVCQVLETNRQQYASCFSPLPFNSGYFMCVQLKESINAESVRQKLLKEYSTGVIAIGNMIRIAFSSVAEKDIPVLFENLYTVCSSF